VLVRISLRRGRIQAELQPAGSPMASQAQLARIIRMGADNEDAEGMYRAVAAVPGPVPATAGRSGCATRRLLTGDGGHEGTCSRSARICPDRSARSTWWCAMFASQMTVSRLCCANTAVRQAWLRRSGRAGHGHSPRTQEISRGSSVQTARPRKNPSVHAVGHMSPLPAATRPLRST
jgi:hypothetical protein